MEENNEIFNNLMLCCYTFTSIDHWDLWWSEWLCLAQPTLDRRVMQIRHLLHAQNFK